MPNHEESKREYFDSDYVCLKREDIPQKVCRTLWAICANLSFFDADMECFCAGFR